MRRGVGTTRPPPRTGPEDRPRYLVTDGIGHLSRRADAIEAVRLGRAGELLGHAADLLADHRATPAQLRFPLARTHEAPTGVQRTAESRGARLAASVHDDPDGSHVPEDADS